MIVAVLVSFAAGCVLGVWISTALTATLSRAGAVCPAAPLEKTSSSWHRRERRGRIPPRQKRRGALAVQFNRSMLDTVQQEVVSALMNLGVKFGEAEGAVLAATARGTGQSFDEVFRVAVALAQAKGRKAAAA